MSTGNSSGTPMPRKDTQSTSTEPEINDNPARLRLLVEDQAEAAALVKDMREEMPDITVQTILRDSVHMGLPLVRKKYEAMREAAKQIEP